MFGSGFEHHGNPFERNSRMFKKGDMKYVILELVKDKPSHGYEITQAMEDRFHGLYSPSAGSVYPVLQLLEDMEYVTSNLMDGKKVYTITDKGKKFWKTKRKQPKKLEDDWMAGGEQNAGIYERGSRGNRRLERHPFSIPRNIDAKESR